MKSTVPNTDDEIEVLEEKNGQWGRIRIRERQGANGFEKCSIFLPPDQLEEHARACLALAAGIRTRHGLASGTPASSENQRDQTLELQRQLIENQEKLIAGLRKEIEIQSQLIAGLRGEIWIQSKQITALEKLVELSPPKTANN